MANVLSESKHQQVLALGRLGWTLRRIEEELGVRRETAGRYLRAAGIEVREPGRWGKGRPSKAAIEVSTDSDAGFSSILPGRSPSVSAAEPHRDLIEAAVRLGRDAMSIWQDLVDDNGFKHGYASVRRFVSRLRAGSPDADAHPVIVTGPGEESQVDYGTGPMVRPSPGAKHKRTRLSSDTQSRALRRHPDSRTSVESKFLIFRSSVFSGSASATSSFAVRTAA
jgi:hypothetical protein